MQELVWAPHSAVLVRVQTFKEGMCVRVCITLLLRAVPLFSVLYSLLQLCPPLAQLSLECTNLQRIQDIIMIGSFLKGTHMVGHLVGDLVVAFSEMPTG